MDQPNQESEIEYIDHVHIRLRCGLELLGVLVSIEDELMIHRPVRIEYTASGIKLLPLSYFSDREFFSLEYHNIVFRTVMNEASYERYEEFCSEFELHQLGSSDDSKESVVSKETVSPKKTLH